MLIQAHGVHENAQNNSFIVSDLLGFFRARKKCFDLGVQEIINLLRSLETTGRKKVCSGW